MAGRVGGASPNRCGSVLSRTAPDTADVGKPRIDGGSAGTLPWRRFGLAVQASGTGDQGRGSMSRHGGVLLRARRARRLVLAALGAATLVVAQAASGVSAGVTPPVTAAAASGSTGHPNRFNPAPAGKPVNHLPAPPATPKPPTSLGPPRIPPVPMRPALVALDPASGGQAGEPPAGAAGDAEAPDVPGPAAHPAGADAAGAGGAGPGVRWALRGQRRGAGAD